MAEQANKQESPEAPLSDVLKATMEAAKQRVEERLGARSATDALRDETTRHPFSMRLTAREVHRLRTMALLEGEGATEIARRLLLEGLLRLEAKHLADPKRSQLVEMVDHLNAQVDATKAIIDLLRGGLSEAQAPSQVSQPRKKRGGRPSAKGNAGSSALD